MSFIVSVTASETRKPLEYISSSTALRARASGGMFLPAKPTAEMDGLALAGFPADQGTKARRPHLAEINS